MVIFEYTCQAGNEPIEHLAPLGKAPDEITCPDHQSIAKRKVSAASFLSFPGSYKAAHPKT